MRRFLLFPFLLIAVSISSCSGNKTLTVSDAWGRPASAGENSAVYFIIDNGTNADDALLSASTDIAEAAESHMTMENAQGVVSMSMQEAIQIPAGERVSFEPRGLHLMLVNLNKSLNAGDTFSVFLHFEKAGDITLQVEVREQ